MNTESISIFQIGDVRLFGTLKPTDWNQSDIRFESSPVSILQSSRLSLGKFYRDSRNEVTLKGYLVDNYGMSPTQVFGALRAYIETELDVIGFLDLTYSPKNPENDCADGSIPLLWVHTTGVLSSVKMSEDIARSGVAELEIKMKLQTYWEGLNRYLWEFRSTKYSTTGYIDDPATINPYVHLSDIVHNNQGLWVYKPISSLYDPLSLPFDLQANVWRETWNGQIPEGMITTGFALQEIDFLVRKNPQYFWGHYIDPGLWPEQPSCLYRLELIGSPVTYGTFTVNQTHQQNAWNTVDATTVVDLDALDTLMTTLGYGGIGGPGIGGGTNVIDYVFFGSGAEYLPGYTIRTEWSPGDTELVITPLLDAIPPITYTGTYAGQLYPGSNNLEFVVEDTSSNIKANALIKYRM